MRNYIYCLTLLFFILNIPLNASAQKVKTEKYKYKQVYYPNSKDTNASYSFSFDIETFKNPRQNSVYEEINHRLMHYLSLPTTEHKDIKEIVKGLIAAECEDFNAVYQDYANDDAYNLHYSLDLKISYNGTYKGVIGFTVFFTTYTGGAHPMDSFITLNYGITTGQILELKDIFKPGFEKNLPTMLLEKLDTEVLFNKFVIDLPEQFTFQKEGINFIYNRYEIAPYVAGPQEALLNYTEMDNILKDTYRVSQK